MTSHIHQVTCTGDIMNPPHAQRSMTSWIHQITSALWHHEFKASWIHQPTGGGVEAGDEYFMLANKPQPEHTTETPIWPRSTLIMDDILDGKIILFKIASNVSSLWSFPTSTIEMLLTYEQPPWSVGGLRGTPGVPQSSRLVTAIVAMHLQPTTTTSGHNFRCCCYCC